MSRALRRRFGRPRRRPSWQQRLWIAEAATSHDGIAYAARQYPEAVGTYSGSTDLTEYFVRRSGEWVPLGWTHVPSPAYRRLRAALKESRARLRGRVVGA